MQSSIIYSKDVMDSLSVYLVDYWRLNKCALRSPFYYSDRALFVFLLRSFIIKNTKAYELMQNRAVIPV